jgi:transposase
VYDGRERCWRHLDLAGTRTVFQYRLRRVDCPRCGVVVEMVPWAEAGSWFTHDFEQTAAYLAQHAAKSVVVEMMRVAWTTVGAIIQRVVDRLGPQDRLADLTHIGVDELSYRKHHEYVTVVIDHRRQAIVWAAKGKSADTLRGFFQALGPERTAKLESVSIDMSAAYISAVKEAAPQANIVFDKFHVQRLAHDALDELRRAEVRSTEDKVERKALKHSRFALQKNTWNLTDIEHQKLTEVQRTNRRLYRGYLLSTIATQRGNLTKSLPADPATSSLQPPRRRSEALSLRKDLVHGRRSGGSAGSSGLYRCRLVEGGRGGRPATCGRLWRS